MFIILYLLAFTFYLLPSAQAEGLSTPFADVQVGSVPVGKPFLITGSMGNGLLLRNLGDAAVRVRVDVLQPPTAELRSGAAPIPDVHWIQVEPDRLELPAHGEAVCRIMLLVPAQRKYRRKQYQATLWSRTEPSDAKPVALSAGLLSRVRFKTQ